MIKDIKSFYIGYCRFFSHSKFLMKLGNRIKSQKLGQISNFLINEFNLIPSEVIITSFLTFFLLLVPTLIISAQINIGFGILISISISYAIAFKIYNFPISKYSQAQFTLLQYSDLAFQDLILILNTTNSLFDAIYFIAIANYPILSEKFDHMLFNVLYYGKSPESQILEFIDQLPNGNLKERLVGLVATKFHPDKIVNQLELLAGDKKHEYDVFTKQLESKLIIIVGICLFIPILTALFISFAGPSSNFYIFFFLFLFFFLTGKFKKAILKSNFILFGELPLLNRQNSGILDSELIEFVTLLGFFGNELKLGVPQEIALLKAFASYQGPLNEVIGSRIKHLYQLNQSFKQIWKELKILIKNTQIQFLLDIIGRMLDKSSEETGVRIQSIIQQIKINRELINDRESIIKAQKFKIQFLTIIMSAILGLIAGLTPVIFSISRIFTNPTEMLDLNFWTSLPLTLCLLLMSLYSSYSLNRLVRNDKALHSLLWTTIVFIILWYATTLFLF
ncbi:MAG: hypothetical protein EU532_13280 [Promethearchaeota archaeon]|nr:MAG: hypothetical protein EU532_13280 [Candidatus Lokiarchaeota archaeon]